MDNRRILGSSPQAQLLQKLVEQTAHTSIPVLMCGEPGVGREFIGRQLHEQGGRSGPFVRMSCAGLSEAVLRSELERRAAQARGGTLFVESLEEAPLTSSDLAVNARLIGSTTLGNGADRIPSGVFGIRMQILPLRDRRSDIPVMIDHFIREFAPTLGKPVRGVQPAAMKKLMNYQWPGNIREVRDAVERALTSTTRDLLDLDDFAFLVTAEEERPLQFMIPGATIHDIEREAILRTVEHAGGSTTAAARMLKMSVRKVQYKLKQYRIADDAKRSAKAKAAGQS